MRKLKALCLTISLYSGLLWGYIATRIIALSDPSCWASNFIDEIPITFWQLGIVAFLVSGVTFFGYLVISNEN